MTKNNKKEKEGIRYSAMLITQHLDGRWRAHSYTLSGIRQPEEVAPNSLGFYYFPSKDEPEVALRQLKDKMIQERKIIIEKLAKEIQDIEEVRLRTKKCKSQQKEQENDEQ